MLGTFQICGCDHRYSWIIQLVLVVSSISLLIISVFVPIWAKTNDNELGLYSCYSTCAKSNYKDQRSLVCSQASFSQSFSDPSISNILESGCEMFKNLENAFYIYSLTSGAALFFSFFWILSLVTFFKKFNPYFCGLSFGILSMLSQWTGVIFWILESNTNFYDCIDFPTDGTAPQLCGDYGIRVAIASGLAYLLSVLYYTVIGKYARQRIMLSKSNKTFHVKASTVAPSVDLDKKAWVN